MAIQHRSTTEEANRTSIRYDWRGQPPVLRGPHVTVRELRRADAASLLRHLATAEVGRFIDPAPPTLEGMQEFVRWTHRERRAGRYLCLGIVPAGESAAVGVIEAWPIERRFEVVEWGFALGSAFWGSGLFIESARLFANFIFDALGTRRLEARAAVGNQRGLGALTKLGAVKEGVLRQCFTCEDGPADHHMWSILAEEWRRSETQRTRLH